MRYLPRNEGQDKAIEDAVNCPDCTDDGVDINLCQKHTDEWRACITKDDIVIFSK
jgi:hypothetical protein